MEWKKKKKIVSVTGAFFLVMLLCTFISKCVYASLLPQVTVKEAQKSSISHSVEASGSVSQSREYAVSVLSGLRVDAVYVGLGYEITEDTLLYSLDLKELEKQIAGQQVEIQKLAEQLKVLEQNLNLDRTEKSVNQRRAQEDYNRASQKNEENVSRETQKENQAAAGLQKHLNGEPSVTSQEERQKKIQEYENWQAQVKNMEVLIEELRKQLGQKNEGMQEDAVNQTSLPGTNQETSPLNQADVYNQSQIQEQIDRAEAELKSLKETGLSRPDYAQEDENWKDWNATRASLEEALQSIGKEKEDAILSGQEDLLAADRKREDAATPDAADSGITVSRLELDYKEQILAEYQQLLKNEGKVLGTGNGVVTAVNVAVGENTPQGAGIVYADKEENLEFKALLTEDQKKYVEQGMEVKLDFTGKYPVESVISYVAEANNGYEVAVDIPDGSAAMGQSGTLTAETNSKSYSGCIPVSALHEENKHYFIYVVREQKGILGIEIAAEKRFVAVLEQNDSYAALEEGTLSEGEKVIVTSTKELKDGDVVKYRLDGGE